VALAGSFNPPHRAHLALLRAGLDATGASAALFVLSARTVDKEQPSGLLLEDRLWLLCRLAGELQGKLQGELSAEWARTPGAPQAPAPRIGVAVTNRGLYVDQASALHRLAPGADFMLFVLFV
jgi:hypothetical protein